MSSSVGDADLEQAPVILDRFLCAVAPKPDPATETVARIVARVASDPELTRVGDLADRVGISVRTLQRLSAEYVGVPPKWVIRRNRLHEAAQRAGSGERVDWPRLAAELGY